MEKSQNQNKLAPVCLFTYNRLSETQQTVEALRKNYLAPDSELFVFSDGPKDDIGAKKVKKVRQYLKTIKGFKSITINESPTNKGLANSIISGVTKIIKQYRKIIVLEDDLITTPNFLDFMNRALDYYETFNNIKSVNGYSLHLKKTNINKNYDVYFQTRSFPWGWGTWESEWNEGLFYNSKLYRDVLKSEKVLKRNLGFDIPRMLKGFLEEKNNSWYVRFVIQHFIENKLSVYPVLSKVENIGFLNNGTHCNSINSYVHNLDTFNKREFMFSNEIYKEDEREFLKYFKNIYKFKYRLVMLGYKKGRIEVRNEVINKLKK